MILANPQMIQHQLTVWEGSGRGGLHHGLIEVLGWHFPEGMRKASLNNIHETSLWAKILTCYLPDVKQVVPTGVSYFVCLFKKNMNLRSGNLFTSLQGVSRITVKVSFKIEMFCILLYSTSGHIQNYNHCVLRCLWWMIVKVIVFYDGTSCSLTDSSKYYLLTTVQKTITVLSKHVWQFSLAVIFCLCMHVCVGACTWVGENWLYPFWLTL